MRKIFDRPAKKCFVPVTPGGTPCTWLAAKTEAQAGLDKLRSARELSAKYPRNYLFKLETAPAGMAIDNKTGRIDWQVPPGNKDTQRIRVMVEDGHKGHAFQEFTLTPPPS